MSAPLVEGLLTSASSLPPSIAAVPQLGPCAASRAQTAVVGAAPVWCRGAAVNKGATTAQHQLLHQLQHQGGALHQQGQTFRWVGSWAGDGDGAGARAPLSLEESLSVRGTKNFVLMSTWGAFCASLVLLILVPLAGN